MISIFKWALKRFNESSMEYLLGLVTGFVLSWVTLVYVLGSLIELVKPR